MVRPAGIEPAAYSLGGYRSIQLSYERVDPLVDALAGSVKEVEHGRCPGGLCRGLFGGHGMPRVTRSMPDVLRPASFATVPASNLLFFQYAASIKVTLFTALLLRETGASPQGA